LETDGESGLTDDLRFFLLFFRSRRPSSSYE
jgi:hypothetical protein